jgi:TRAP-type transport system small permease protein
MSTPGWNDKAGRALAACNQQLARAIGAMMILLVIGMLAALTWQIVMRYAFRQAPAWSEEAALLMQTWMVLLGCALGVREGFHVRMDLLFERLPPALKERVELLIACFTIAAGCCLVWSGAVYVRETLGSTSAAVGYPIELLYVAGPVCGLLIALFGLEKVFQLLAPPARP